MKFLVWLRVGDTPEDRPRPLGCGRGPFLHLENPVGFIENKPLESS